MNTLLAWLRYIEIESCYDLRTSTNPLKMTRKKESRKMKEMKMVAGVQVVLKMKFRELSVVDDSTNEGGRARELPLLCLLFELSLVGFPSTSSMAREGEIILNLPLRFRDG